MTKAEFSAMLRALAEAWTRHDYAAVCDWFADDVRYADPTRYALRGKKQLRAFFEDDGGHPQRSLFHVAVFDEDQQTGAAEYTYKGHHQYHGVVLIRVKGGKITHWREYQHVDERPWADFTASTAF